MKTDLAVLALLTVLLLAALWTLLPDQWQSNQNYDYTCCYEPVARNWIEGKGWVMDNGMFGGSYPPGYSILIAGVKLSARGLGGDEGLAMRLSILLCTLVTVLVLYLLGLSIGGPWLARASAVSALGYPFFLWLAKQPNSETPFIPLLAMSVYGYVRLVQANPQSRAFWRWAALCGLFSGLAALVRAISVFSGIVLALCAWQTLRRSVSGKRRAGMVATVLAMNLLTVLPWELRLHAERGGWPLLADSGGVSFLQGLTFGLDKPELPPAPVPVDVRSLMERADARRDEIRGAGGLLRFLCAEAVAHPRAFAKLMWLKMTRVWFASHSTARAESATGWMQGLFMTCVAAGLWGLHRRAPGAVLGLAALTLYFWGMAALVVPLLRYMVPVSVVLAVGTGAAIVAFAGRLRWIRELPGVSL